MKKYIARILLVLIFIGHQLPHLARSTDIDAVNRAKELQSHLNGLTSLTFNFTQRTSGQLSGRARQASGQAFLVRTGEGSKMRWNYLIPDRQVIISDGITLKMYFEKLNQMIISPANALQKDITYSFFTGSSDITDDFSISSGIDERNLMDKNGSPFDVIHLAPHDNSVQVKKITLWITASNVIQRIEIHDAFDTVTLLTLSSIEENTLPSKDTSKNTDLFGFSPPEGTEIIHQ